MQQTAMVEGFKVHDTPWSAGIHCEEHARFERSRDAATSFFLDSKQNKIKKNSLNFNFLPTVEFKV